MAFEKPGDVKVIENNLVDMFPEGIEFYGSRLINSSGREELSGLAKKVWEDEEKVHPIYAIRLVEVKEFGVGDGLSFFGISEAYKLDHSHGSLHRHTTN